MSIMAISSIVFAFLLGGTLLGIAFRGALPGLKDLIRKGVGKQCLQSFSVAY